MRTFRILLLTLLILILRFYLYAGESVKIYHAGEGRFTPLEIGCQRQPSDASCVLFLTGFTFPFGKTYSYSDILVTKAIDGDTLALENGERVRLIGIDTPEMHLSSKLYKDSQRTKQDANTIQQLGRRAYKFTLNLVEGKRVNLEFDAEKHDRYGRLLAYVFLKDKDATFVNAKIIEEGHASLMTIPPNVKYADLFLKLYREARENKRGLWK